MFACSEGPVKHRELSQDEQGEDEAPEKWDVSESERCDSPLGVEPSVSLH